MDALEIFGLVRSGEDGEEGDSAVVVKEDVGGVQIAHVGALSLEKSSNSQQYQHQIPQLVLGKQLSDFTAVLHLLLQRVPEKTVR